jgi:hypothetical protein
VRLELELDRDRVAAGEEVAGRIRVLEGGPSRSLTLTLVFTERTLDYSATPLVSSSVVHEGELATGATFDFGFAVPPEAPPSFETEHSELSWELEARSADPGLDTSVRRRIEIAPARLPARATFACSVCGQEAGVIRIHAGEGRTELRRESWPGVLILPRSVAQLDPFLEALAGRNVPALFALDPELTPFYCPTCDASYCSDHWDWWDVWDDEFVGWRDSVRGRCPQGHERMLED